MKSRPAVLGAAIAVLAVTLTLASFPLSAAADDDEEPPGAGGADIAIPSPDAKAQLDAASRELQVEPELAPVEPQLQAQTASPSQPLIDDFGYSEIISEGTAAEVCYGRLRPGTAGAFQAIVTRFGGAAGTLYSCRERYATHERAECNGQVADPIRTPNFFSDCWSNHAQGRAFDVMVGRTGSGWNRGRGDGIVNWLLATDAAGNQNANARRLGVQQILWNDRCWNSDGDRGIANAAMMRTCGYGHFDHVHVDLTLPGAGAATSWWGGTPIRAPKENGIYFRAPSNGEWSVQTWVNWRVASRTGGQWSTMWTQVVTGDWDSDGARDDLFVWNDINGVWTIRSFAGTSQAVTFTGNWSGRFETFVNGDFDRDGREDDMVILDKHLGDYELWTWSTRGPSFVSSGRWGSQWDTLVALDADSDGRVAETFLIDRDTGRWYVHAWTTGAPDARYSRRWLNHWDQFVVGDFDAQGNRDDMFVRDNQTGEYWLVSFSGQGTKDRGIGHRSTKWDTFAIGDFDTDGRLDEIFARDNNSGDWVIWTFHRYGAHQALTSNWSTKWRQFVGGVFG